MEAVFVEFGIQVAKAVIGTVLIVGVIAWLVITHTILNPNKSEG